MILGILLRILSRDEIDSIIDADVARSLISGIISLLKQKSNIKILGIKIASFLQHLSCPTIQKDLQCLKKEMLKCMCCEDSKVLFLTFDLKK